MFQCIAHGHLYDPVVETLAAEFGFKKWERFGEWPDCADTIEVRGRPVLCNRGVAVAVYERAREHETSALINIEREYGHSFTSQ